MRLHELPKILACSKNTKRRGKGVGSGQGKTAGRGHKGGKARAGYSPAPCCSGVPFYRHLPIRGFSNAKFRAEHVTVKLRDIAALGVNEVDAACMRKAGLIKGPACPIKVLGGAVLSEALTVIADKFSRSAAAEIERVGGKIMRLSYAMKKE